MNILVKCEIGFWTERINGIQAMRVLERCIDKMNDQEGEDCEKVKPVGNCKTFLNTLQFSGSNTWFIQYNDKTDNTKIAAVEITPEEIKEYDKVEDFIV